MAQSVKSMAAQTTAATQKVEVGFQSLKAAAGPLLAAFAAFKGATAAFSFAGSSIEAFNTQEEAVRRLTKALELNGAAASSVTGHQEFASKLQNLTNVGDEVTLGLMAQAASLGVSDDQLQNVTKTAIGLAEATGMGLEEALKKTNEAINGNAGAFGEFLPALKTMGSEEEKLAAVIDIANKGLAQSQDKTNSAAGAAQRAANSWGDFKEKIGELIAPIHQLVSTGFAVAAEVLQDVLAPALDAAGGFAGVFAAATERMKAGIVGSITAVEVLVTNLPAVFEMMVAKAQLSMIQLVEGAKHSFTVAIPAYFAWFRDNFTNIISDAFHLALTITKNRLIQMKDLALLGFQGILDVTEWLGDVLPDVLSNMGSKALSVLTGMLNKIGEIFTRAWDWITGYFTSGGEEVGGTLSESLSGVMNEATKTLASPPADAASYAARFGEIISRNLTDGFVATTEPLPDIAARQITDREQELQAKIGGIASDLGTQFSDKYNERMKGLGASAAEEITTSLKGVDSKQAADAIAEDLATGIKQGTEGIAKAQSEVASLTATESRLQTRGKADQGIDRIAKNTENANKILADIAKKVEPKPAEQSSSLRLELVV
jgi:hypothetical protein